MVDAALQNTASAVVSLEKALALNPTGRQVKHVLCLAYVMQQRFDDGKRMAEISLAEGDHYLPHIGLAYYYLHRREWKRGWFHYKRQMGMASDRKIQNYGLPQWQGEGSVLIYGEQGLGDQLVYSSATDIRCKQLVCHPKLYNLLKRSMECEVYGDQFAKQIEWPIKAEHQASMSEAMQYQEVKPRGRWLKPHPDKKVQWQGLMEARASVVSRPWIGLAWTGGNVGGHGWRTRNVTQHDLKPILDLPFNFVSLEYRPHADIPNVHQWPWATQTNDLDDFAALVDCLSAVVCVPTTTYHVAGGLGIPAKRS